MPGNAASTAAVALDIACHATSRSPALAAAVQGLTLDVTAQLEQLKDAFMS
jgi:hypothetical protein